MNLRRKIQDRALSIPAHLAFRWANLPAVSAAQERRGENSLRRRLCVDFPLPHEMSVVAGLERDGVFVTDLASIGLADTDAQEIMNSGSLVAGRLAERAAGFGDNRPVMTVSQPDDLLHHRAIYRWGLNAVLLRIVEAYLKRSVAYDGPVVFHTPANGREEGTRQWHLDREDRRVIKVALYLNDVAESDGPFQILKHEHRRSGARFEYRAMTTAELQRSLAASGSPLDIVTCTGKAGTLVFADTARFYHRGKPATGRDRSAIFFSYVSRSPRHPFFCERTHLHRKQIVGLVEGLNPAQKACALWRDELSWLARLIPASPT